MTDKASSLQHEIRQHHPFQSLHEEALLGLFRTTDLLRRLLSAVMEPHGITSQQYNVLRILRGAGDEGLPTLEIVERMVESAPGITRLLDHLEAKQLVCRKRCDVDRRQVFCRIGPAGLELLSGLDKPVEQAVEESLSMLEPAEVEQLIRVLDKIRGTAPAPGCGG